MHDLASILKLITLFILQWVLIITLYVVGLYSMVLFQQIFTDISGWPLPSVIRSLVMIVWAAMPVSVCAYLVNRIFFGIPKKFFWYTQVAFVLTVWLSLTILILLP